MRKSPVDVYSILRKRIVLGEFQPGHQLKELPLAQELGISRSPLRAAFKRLADDGLVHIETNRGVFVSAWTESDDDETFDLRVLIEAHAAGLAAQRRQPEHLAQMRDINTAMESLISKRPADFLAQMEIENRKFHTLIARAAASPRLISMIDSLFQAQRLNGFFYATDAQIRDSLAAHEQITLAVAQKDSQRARTLMHTHIHHAWERLKVQRKQAPEKAPEHSHESA